MKKMLTILTVLIVMMFGIRTANALTFSEGFQQTGTKPMLLLVYATWSDGYKEIEKNFIGLQETYGNKINFVTMDIANQETKAFNEKFHIYPKLPYVLMFRDAGRVTRYVQKDCASNPSCMAEKVRAFMP